MWIVPFKDFEWINYFCPHAAGVYGCLEAQAGQLSYPSPPFATDDKLTKVRNSCMGSDTQSSNHSALFL